MKIEDNERTRLHMDDPLPFTSRTMISFLWDSNSSPSCADHSPLWCWKCEHTASLQHIPADLMPSQAGNQ
ncbi:hypothetical protein E2C01_051610 [Portunus trituberculatus]|uniref:Uncharacterized protein n=1 Tax=Portunus trituberculatus TaxID=210409 RepID=A0A5B7GJT6_PORTR|nr:hypothetical protein [Portunus trituberculatus]